MNKYIENKTVVVTGGADGIGFGIANKYLENGAKVTILVDINTCKGKAAEETLNNKHGKGKAEFIKGDVTRDLEATYQIIMDKYKYVDVLVNSAGIAQGISRKVIEVNAIALIEWSLEFYKLMNKDNGGKGGTLVNIASVLGYEITPYAHAYLASKFAVTGFTRSLGHTSLYALTGVRTISLCPGITVTNLTKKVMSMKPDNKIAAELGKNWININTQKVDVVAEAALEILDRGPSGSMWSIVDSELRKVDVEIKLTL